MNLTLDIEDHLPEIFITGIRSNLSFHELVYHINKLNKINLIRERILLKVERKNQIASFSWFSLTETNNTENFLFLLNNVSHYELEKKEEFSLFGNNLVEQRMILFQSLKRFDFLFVHPNSDIQQINLVQLIKKTIIQAHLGIGMNDLKKPEQLILENIYYEKQD